MVDLILGVIDQPYNEPSGQTTGGVAEILEDKYHVVQVFYNQHEAEIGKAMEDSVGQALDGLLQGAPINRTPFAAATDTIKHLFNVFIDSDEMAKLGIPGVPTKAALAGVQTAKKRRKGSPRVSFVDTGLYRDSFKAWTE